MTRLYDKMYPLIVYSEVKDPFEGIPRRDYRLWLQARQQAQYQSSEYPHPDYHNRSLDPDSDHSNSNFYSQHGHSSISNQYQANNPSRPISNHFLVEQPGEQGEGEYRTARIPVNLMEGGQGIVPSGQQVYGLDKIIFEGIGNTYGQTENIANTPPVEGAQNSQHGPSPESMYSNHSLHRPQLY